MLEEEVQKLKEFYAAANPEQQAAIRGMIMLRYYDDNEALFTNCGYADSDAFAGTTDVEQTMPEQVWTFLQQPDADVHTVEELAAYGILESYKAEKALMAFAGSSDGTEVVRKLSLDSKRIDRIISAMPEDRQKIIARETAIHEEEQRARAEFGLPPRDGSTELSSMIEHDYNLLPFLDQQKLSDIVRQLVMRSESEIMSRGRGERGRG